MSLDTITTTSTNEAPPPVDHAAAEEAELAAIIEGAREAEPAPAAVPAKPAEKAATDDKAPTARDFVGLRKLEKKARAEQATATAKIAEAQAAETRLRELAKTDRLAVLRELGIDDLEIMKDLTARGLDPAPDTSALKKEVETLRADVAKREEERVQREQQAEARARGAEVERAFVAGVADDPNANALRVWQELHGEEAMLAAANATADRLSRERGPGKFTLDDVRAAMIEGAEHDLDETTSRAEKIRAAMQLTAKGLPAARANGAAAAPSTGGKPEPRSISNATLAAAPPEGESDEEETARLEALIRNSRGR